MPTRFTDPVGQTDDVSFRDFALDCARVFVTRDLEGPLPLKLPVSTEKPELDRALQNLSEAKEAHRAFVALRLSDLEERWMTEHQQAVRIHAEIEAEYAPRRRRYNRMLKLATSWEPPSADHDQLKGFMVKQLEESLRWDTPITEVPVLRPFAEWCEQRVNGLKRDIERLDQCVSWAKEKPVYPSRQEWLDQLRESLL